jgi:purine catabolism regulator
VFTRILAEQYDTLQRAVDAEHILTRAVMEGEGVEGVTASLAQVTKGWVMLLDLHGLPLAATSRAAAARAERVWGEIRSSRPDGTSFSLSLVDKGHHVWVQPVGAQGRVEAFLVVGKPEQPSQLDRIVAGHALSLFAIELASSRAVADTERRLQGDFFDQLAAGTLPAADAARGLARFGFARDGMVVAVAMEGPDPLMLAQAVEDHGSRLEGGFLVSRRDDGASLLLPAGSEQGLEELVKSLGVRLGQTVLGGAGSVVAPVDTGRSLREARYALRVSRLEGWTFAGFDDLGTYRLLLSMADPDALRAFAESILGPLDAYDRDQHGELVPSLRAFLQHNSRWEVAAAELFVHRHTLRYRIRKVEELTGRDVSSSFDRMEFWLALRARDLMTADVES